MCCWRKDVLARMEDVLAEYPHVPQKPHLSPLHWQKGYGDAAEERFPGDTKGKEESR